MVAFANTALRRGTFYPVVELLGETWVALLLQIVLVDKIRFLLKPRCRNENRNLHHSDDARLTERCWDGNCLGDHGQHWRGWL